MDDLANIRATIDAHKKQFPNHRRYPKEIWSQVLPLADKYDHHLLARELNINLNNLRKRIKRNASQIAPVEENTPFIQIPHHRNSRAITLELPHNIKLRIEL